ncbi:hypothetical protein P355_3371 [Burkholderia cenocepacia KC-01]|nr:hypothetical protein P355_3371 [Burkholderia cenocepacia KC-01]
MPLRRCAWCKTGVIRRARPRMSARPGSLPSRIGAGGRFTGT